MKFNRTGQRNFLACRSLRSGKLYHAPTVGCLTNINRRTHCTRSKPRALHHQLAGRIGEAHQWARATQSGNANAQIRLSAWYGGALFKDGNNRRNNDHWGDRRGRRGRRNGHGCRWQRTARGGRILCYRIGRAAMNDQRGAQGCPHRCRRNVSKRKALSNSSGEVCHTFLGSALSCILRESLRAAGRYFAIGRALYCGTLHIRARHQLGISPSVNAACPTNQSSSRSERPISTSLRLISSSEFWPKFLTPMSSASVRAASSPID